ncbi:MAG: aminotransferase class I/II-fold pyridoxal phosphate-dependent enzyme, partial [Candidatus Delongbacteria bacterium]
STTGIHGCNLMGYTAGEAAYSHGGQWLDELLQYLTKNIDIIDDFLKNELPGIKMQRPQSTYLAWLDFRKYGLSQKDLVQKMIHEARLGLNDGSAFGPGGEGFMRLNFACPNSIVIEALERLKKTFG